MTGTEHIARIRGHLTTRSGVISFVSVSYLKISKVDETTFKKNLCAVNDAQEGAGISQFHLQEINETEIHAYSWALLPGSYDRKTFGANLMLWTRDMDRLGIFIEHALAA